MPDGDTESPGRTAEAETPLERAGRRIYDLICEYELAAASALVLILTLLALAYAVRRPIWLDEYLGMYTALLPSAAAIWTALLTAPLQVDPPLFHWIAHFSGQMFPDKELAVRLPSVIGYGATLILLYRVVRRFSDAVVALLAIVLTPVTLIFRYAHEARPYSLMLLAGVTALYFWLLLTEREQRRTGYLLGLSFSLAVCVSLHWFAGLMVLPLVCGELLRIVRRKRVDWGVLTALFTGCSIALLYLPLLSAAVAFRPQPGRPPAAGGSGELFQIYFRFFEIGVPVGLCVVLVIVAAALLIPRMGSFGGTCRAVPPEHAAAFLVLCLLPFPGRILAVATKASFEPRFFLGAVAGVIVLCVLGASTLMRGRGLLLLAALLIGGGASMLRMGLILRHLTPDAALFAPLPAQMQSLAEYPIAVDNIELFLRLSNHAPPELSRRLVHLGEIRKTAGGGGIVWSLLHRGLRYASSLPLVETEPFLAEHQKFYYLVHPDDDRWVKRAAALHARHFKMEFVASYLDNDMELFLVSPADAGAVAADAASMP